MSFEKLCEAYRVYYQAHEGEFLALKAEGTNVFRLFPGTMGGVSGLVVDALGPVLMFQTDPSRFSKSSKDLEAFAQWLATERKATAVYLKEFVPDRSSVVAGLESHRKDPFWGKPVPEKFLVQERGRSFWVKPYGGFSSGLFVDQRANRQWVAERAGGKRVLNAFAYTCSFSVVAALEGATVTSVDLSAKYLEWGKENFIANGLDPQKHRFFALDYFRFVKAAVKRGETYDIVILDPPSFSRNKDGKVFSLRKDRAQLLEVTEPLLAEGASILFSSNLSELTDETLKSDLHRAWEGSVALEPLELPSPVFDCAGAMAPLSAVAYRCSRTS